MYEYIDGKITEITPAYAIVENNGIGYFVHISVNTYSQLSPERRVKLYIHQIVREDALLLYGFFEKKEREIFLHLISVSGVGANTARMMLSSMAPDEIETAVLNGDVNLLKSIKGIGAKSAQRIIVDLKDKFGKIAEGQDIAMPGGTSSAVRSEATSALVMLGFTKNTVEKTIEKILKQEPQLGVEELVKKALKRL